MNNADQFLSRDELAGVEGDLTHVYSSQAGAAGPEITEMGDPCHNLIVWFFLVFSWTFSDGTQIK
jgi:hypothetical protein